MWCDQPAHWTGTDQTEIGAMDQIVIGVNPHVKGGALQGGSGPASAAFDAGLLPIGSHGGGIVGVIRPIGG